MCKLIYYIFLSSLTAIFVSCQESKPENPATKKRSRKELTQDEQKQHIKEQLKRTFLRDIEISGVTVDEHGNPLDKVGVDYTIHDPKQGSLRKMRILEDGRFVFKQENCLAMNLYFSKPGYFQKKLVFDPHSPKSWGPPKWNEKTLPNGRVVIRENSLQVKLESLGGPWNLMDKYRVECEFSTKGKWKGTVFSPNPDYSDENRKKRNVKPFLTEVVEFGSEGIPANCIYLTVPFNGENNLITVEKTFQLKDHRRWYTTEESPRYTTLLTNGELSLQLATGLKTVDPVRYMGEWETLMTRQMKVAPELGYQNEVTVFPAVDAGHRFFYAKIFNQYGRFSLVPPNAMLEDNGDKRLKVSFDLYLQPNGSRDVRSMDGAVPVEVVKHSSEENQKYLKKGYYNFDLGGWLEGGNKKVLEDYSVRVDPNRGLKYVKDLSFRDKFSIEATSRRLDLYFSKKGYFTKHLTINPKDSEQLKTLGLTKQENTITSGKLVISLEETGPLTRMIVKSFMPGDIKFGVEEESVAISLRKKSGAIFLDSMPCKLPKDRPPKESVLYVKSAVEDNKVKVPIEMHYGIGGKGNGVISYTPKDSNKTIKLLLREMKDCPETGYLNEVQLDSAQSVNFFFFKFNDFFGKGYIKYPPQVSKDGKQLVPTISICLQPDGSRNVRTK